LTAYYQRFTTAFPAFTDVWNGLGGRGVVHWIADEKESATANARVELYLARVSPNSHGVWLLLEAAGVKYDLHDVDLGRQEQKSKKFTELNPLQQVPTLRNADGIFSPF